MGKIEGANGTTEYRRSSGRGQAPNDLSRIFDSMKRQEPARSEQRPSSEGACCTPKPVENGIVPLPHYGDPIGEVRPLPSYEGVGSLDNIRPYSTHSCGSSCETTLSGIDSITNEDLAASGETARNLERLYRSLQSAPPAVQRGELLQAREDLRNHLENDYIPRLEQQLADLEVDLPSGSTIVRAEYNEVSKELDLAKALVAELGGTGSSEASEGVNDEEVQASADRIEKLLDSKGWNQWVSRGEIIEVTNEFANLSPEEANAVFDELESRGLIDDLFKEVYDAGHVGGGLPPDVRKQFYDDLAGKLNAENLIHITDELKNVSRSGLGKPEIAEFSDSIAKYADEDVKLDFIEQIADRTTTEASPRDHFPRPGDPDAAAVAQVIASLDENPEAVQKALDLLTDDQLEAVVLASLDPQIVGFVGVLLDSSLYQELSSAVNSIDSSSEGGVEQINRFVGVSSDHLRDLESVQGNIEFKDAFSEIITTHFDQLIGHSLENNGSIDPDFGDDLETFSQYILFSNPPGERQAETAAFIADKITEWKEAAEGGNLSDRVQVGNETRSREAVANLTGQLLAHTLNGLEFAVQDGKADAASEAAANTFIVNIAFDLLPGPDAGKVVDAIYGEIKGETKSEVLSALNGQDVDIDAKGFDEFYEEIRSNIGDNNTEADAEELREQFEDGFTGVRPVDVNRPTS